MVLFSSKPYGLNVFDGSPGQCSCTESGFAANKFYESWNRFKTTRQDERYSFLYRRK